MIAHKWDRDVTVSDSSNILRIQYKVQDRLLEIRFSNGAVYHYENFPEREFGNLVSADSVGGYFQQNLISRYKGIRQ